MTNYKVFIKVDTYGSLVYYLSTNDFEYKNVISVLTIYKNPKIIVYKDLEGKKEDNWFNKIDLKLYNILSYIETQNFYIRLQKEYVEYKDSFVSSDTNLKLLLEDLQRILLYWDD